jgi:DNA-binding transcriptional ArsR family regulator
MPGPDQPLTPDDSFVRLDARSLKVLAHPMRSRLLGALRGAGPSTATDLAGRLGTNSGATSYHLRKLAEVGLVEDTGEGEGKRRLWQAASSYTQWQTSDFAGDEDSETALNWLSRDYLRYLGEKGERWLDVEGEWPLEWRDALGMNDDSVLATAEQVRAMYAEIDDVVKRYRRVGQGNPAARRVSVWTVMYPIDLDRTPRGKDQS